MLGSYASIVKLFKLTMPNNANIEAAWSYHEATKHSYTSVRTNPHSLDFDNQPLPFKIYPSLEPTRMPTDVRQTGVAALSAIAGGVASGSDLAPKLEAVAQLLYLSAGITRQRKYSGGEIYFRAAACTGALYEVELYLVCGDLAGLRGDTKFEDRDGAIDEVKVLTRHLREVDQQIGTFGRSDQQAGEFDWSCEQALVRAYLMEGLPVGE